MRKNIALVLIVNTLCVGSALAYQGSDDADYFREQVAEAYLPQGLRAGSFLFLPSMTQGNEYNSNIYMRDKRLDTATHKGVVDSYIAHYRPSLEVNSDWTRHELNFALNTDITQYASLPDQNNYHDVMASMDYKLDLTRDSSFSGGLAYNDVHENRGAPDQRNGIGPTFYSSKIIDTFYDQKFNRLHFKTGVNTTRYDYQNVDGIDPLTGNVNVLQMSSRDRWEHKPMMRLGYDLHTGYEAFAKFEYKKVYYDTDVLSNGVVGTGYNRNSNGFNATSGLAFDLTNLLTGDISAGYVQRNYDDPRFSRALGVNGFLNLKYKPTKITTVLARVARDINETSQQGVSGSMNTTVNLSVEHELYRNIILKVGGNVGQTGYQGYNNVGTVNAYNRDDLMCGGTAMAKYLINRTFSTDLTYMYSNRDSNYINSNFEVNQLMLNIKGQI